MKTSSQIWGILVALTCFTACEKSNLANLGRVAAAPPTQRSFTLKISNYCPDQGISPVHFGVSNFSSGNENNLIVEDFDRDGIPNIRDNDNLYNINHLTADTNDDGFSDLVMMVLRLVRADQATLSCPNRLLDTDGDGLLDCEEEVLGTDPLKWDTDGDLISDMMEIRTGLNPVSPDAIQDPDGDNLTNLQESLIRTPIREFNDDRINSYALKYSTENVEGSLGCSNLTVENLPVMDVSNGNLIYGYFLERNLTTGIVGLRVGKKIVPQTLVDKSTVQITFGEFIRQEP